MFHFFSNTGIQFFGNSDVKIDLVNANHQFNASIQDETTHYVSGMYARLLLKNHWLPLALDGRRNLLRVKFIVNAKADKSWLTPLFSIDTALEENQDSLCKNDLGQNLEKLPIFNTVVDDESFSNYYINNMKNITIIDETKTWLNDLHNKEKNGIINNSSFKNELARNNLTVDDLCPITAYRYLILWVHYFSDLFTNPEYGVKILTDQAGAMHDKDVTLVLDLGNSRTVGLLVEDNSESINIANARALSLIDYEKLNQKGTSYLDEYMDKDSKNYSHLISSVLKFRKGIFSDYTSTKNFSMPSIIAMGNEAESMTDEGPGQGRSGISGPKRYLWDDDEQNTFWYFHRKINGEHKTIHGPVMEHIDTNDNDDFYDNHEMRAINPPPIAIHPKRTMMIHAMIEILTQAFCQINSYQYRHLVGEPQRKRSLGKVVLSFPTGMAHWERERLIKQCEKAQIILNERMGFLPYNVDILLGSDEATCSQIAFLYGQTKRFKGDVNKYFNMVSNSAKNRVRIATLDIGGGTSDLMIADYASANPEAGANPDILQTPIFSDGVNFAGDDVIKELIVNRIIPKFREMLQKEDMYKESDPFLDYYGMDSPSVNQDDRVKSMYGLFIPIAEMYLYLMQKRDDGLLREMKKLNTFAQLHKYQKENNLRSVPKTHDELKYIKNIISQKTFATLTLEKLFPASIDELEKEFVSIMKNELMRYSVIINRYAPDFLILAGKTTSLPIVSEFFVNKLCISPDRVIPLHDYYIGNWYPFSKYGCITDAKTGVVTGNLIAHLSLNHKLEDVNIISDGANSPYTLNYIGYMPKGRNTLKNNHVTYTSFDTDNHRPIELVNSLHILTRNIPDEKKICSVQYILRLKREDSAGNAYNIATVVAGQPLKVYLDYGNPQKSLSIVSVEGDVNLNEEIRQATIEDIELKPMTLVNEQYFLDDARFNIQAAF